MSVRLRGFDKLARAVGEYPARLEAGVTAIADAWANEAQSYAQENRRWQDRTGNARIGLRAFVEAERGRGINIFLTTQVAYGVHLELKSGGRYSIIVPTISAKIPELSRALKELLS